MYNVCNTSKKKAYWTFNQTVLQRYQLNNGFQYFFISIFYIFGRDLNLKKDYLLKTYLTGHLASI